MKTALTFILPLVAGLLTGCVGVLPVPPSASQPSHNQPITRAQVRFIVPGQTTRAEVVSRLGDHFRDSPRMPVLAYAWEKPAVGWTWWIFLIGPANIAAGGAQMEGNQWRALFVKFNAADRVEAIKFKSLCNGRSLDEQLEDWAVARKHGFTETGGHLFNPASGVPWMFDRIPPANPSMRIE
jgi:hypothetical protein